MSDTSPIIKVYASQDWVDENYINLPSTAEVGQLLSVKTVDENGKPIEWETVDAPSGEGSGNSVELDTTLTEEGKAADAKAVGDALDGKLSKSGGTMSGKIVFPTADQNVGFTNSEDMKIFGYGTVDGTVYMRIGDTAYPFQIRGNGDRPKYNDDELVLKSELDAIMGAYITDIDTLIGGDA